MEQQQGFWDELSAILPVLLTRVSKTSSKHSQIRYCLLSKPPKVLELVKHLSSVTKRHLAQEANVYKILECLFECAETEDPLLFANFNLQNYNISHKCKECLKVVSSRVRNNIFQIFLSSEGNTVSDRLQSTLFSEKRPFYCSNCDKIVSAGEESTYFGVQDLILLSKRPLTSCLVDSSITLSTGIEMMLSGIVIQNKTGYSSFVKNELSCLKLILKHWKHPNNDEACFVDFGVITPLMITYSVVEKNHPKESIAQPSTQETVVQINNNANKEDDVNQCKVCFDQTANAALIPCGHLALCYSCAVHIQKQSGTCPICRQSFNSVFQVFRA